jgi:hypothetical protein
MTLDQITPEQWQEAVDHAFRLARSAQILMEMAVKSGDTTWTPGKELYDDVKQSLLLLETAEKLGYKPSEGLLEKVDQEMITDATAAGVSVEKKIHGAHKRAVKARKVVEFPRE